MPICFPSHALRRAVCALVLIGPLGACTVHSDYARPAIAVQPHWANGDAAVSGAVPAATGAGDWWRLLGDPAIDQLVAQALGDNPTIDEALARVDQARAQTAADRAAQRPRVDINASAARSQILNTNANGGNLSIDPIRQNGAGIGPGASWEIDLWGRLRRQREASQNRTDARIADVALARLSIAAQIADTVIVLRACRLSLDIASSDIASREREVRIARQRLAFGSVAPADVAGPESNLANARTDWQATNGLCVRSRDALVALSGRDAAAVEAAMAAAPTGSQALALPVPPDSRPAMPAVVLLQHPSVVAAERELAARWMETGAARAERLPRLNLTAVLTGQWLSALGASSTFTTWSAGSALAMPLFDGGASKANVRLYQARYRESLAMLTGVMRDAARDIEDALADQQSAQARVATSQQAVAAAEASFRANDALWRAGSISAFDLEDARRSLNRAQDNGVAALRDRARAWVALIRGTGGAMQADPADDRTRS